MPEAKRQRLAAWVILVVPAFWAINYVVARKAPGVIGPYVLALGRWAMAGLVLSLMARHELWAQRKQIFRDGRQHLVLGFLGMFICGAWVYEGARSTSAMNIALIYAAAPVLISLGSVLFLNEHLRVRQMLGIALALVGVVHVVVRGEWLALAGLRHAAKVLAQFALSHRALGGDLLGWGAHARAAHGLGADVRAAHASGLGALGPDGGRCLGPRCGGLLDLQLGATRFGRQPCVGGVLPGAAVGCFGGLGHLGRAAHLAPLGWSRLDFAWRVFGHPTRVFNHLIDQ
jgi:drug/metabolite transporter (DMT)-like permease